MPMRIGTEHKSGKIGRVEEWKGGWILHNIEFGHFPYFLGFWMVLGGYKTLNCHKKNRI